MDSVADLGLRIDSSQAATAAQVLDKMVPAAARAEAATEALAKVAATASVKFRDEAAAGDRTVATLDRIAAASRRAAQESRAVQNRINAATGVTGTTSPVGRGDDIAAYGAQLDALRAKFNPIFAASKAYESVVEEIAMAHRIGALTTHEMEAALEAERLAFQRASVAATAHIGVVKASGASMASSRYEMINLGRQVGDIGTMVALGASPFAILATQGFQVAEAFATADGGAKGLASRLGGLVTMSRLMAGGFLAVGAALIAMNWDTFQRHVDPTFNQRLDMAKQRLEATQRYIEQHDLQANANWQKREKDQTAQLEALMQEREAMLRRAGANQRQTYLASLRTHASELAAALGGTSEIDDLIEKRAILSQRLRRPIRGGGPALSEEDAEATRRALEAVNGALAARASTTGEVNRAGQTYLSQQQLWRESADAEILALQARTREEKIAAEVAAEVQAIRSQNLPLAEQEERIGHARRRAALRLDLEEERAAEAAAKAQESRDQAARVAATRRLDAVNDNIAVTREQIEAEREVNALVAAGVMTYDAAREAVQRRVRDAKIEAEITAALAKGWTDVATANRLYLATLQELDELQTRDPVTARSQEILEDLRSSVRQYKETIAALQSLQDSGAISGPLAGVMGDRAEADMLRDMIPTDFSSGFIQQLRLMQLEAHNAFADIGQQAANVIGPDGTLVNALGDATGRAIFFGDSFTESMKNAARSIGADLVSSLVKLGLNMMINAALGEGLASAAQAQTMAQAASATAAWAPAAAFASLATLGANAAPAMVGITATTALTAAMGSIAGSMSGFAAGVIGLNGPGTGTSDSIMARLSNGESVITAAGTRRGRNSEYLAAVNRGADMQAMIDAAARSGGGHRAPVVRVVHDGSTGVVIQPGVSPDEVEVIARTLLHNEGPEVAAASQRDPNGIMRKATRDTIAARPRRR